VGYAVSEFVGRKNVLFHYLLIGSRNLFSRGYSFHADLLIMLMIPPFSLLAETHGTCAYPEIQDEYDYFSTALYLYSKYNVTVSLHYIISHLSGHERLAFCRHINLALALALQKALRKAHIRPASGRKYAVGHIVAVIEYAFGAMPSLVCKNGSVQELRLCFHKDYQVGSFYRLCQFLNL
jgi:hypothetical protein